MKHLHRPKTFLREQTVGKTVWTFFACECGQELMPRNAAGRLAPPGVLAQLGADYGYEPEPLRALPE